jgi:hypothetical protein
MLKLNAQISMSLGIFGKNDDTTGLKVNTMDHKTVFLELLFYEFY